MMTVWFLITEEARKALVAFQRKLYPGCPLYIPGGDEPKVSIQPTVENLDEISRLMQKPTKWRLAK